MGQRVQIRLFQLVVSLQQNGWLHGPNPQAQTDAALNASQAKIPQTIEAGIVGCPWREGCSCLFGCQASISAVDIRLSRQDSWGSVWVPAPQAQQAHPHQVQENVPQRFSAAVRPQNGPKSAAAEKAIDWGGGEGGQGSGAKGFAAGQKG